MPYILIEHRLEYYLHYPFVPRSFFHEITISKSRLYFLPPRLEFAIYISLSKSMLEGYIKWWRCLVYRYCLWAKNSGELFMRTVPFLWTATSLCLISLARQKYSAMSTGNSSAVICLREQRVINGLSFSAPVSMASVSIACIEKWRRLKVRFC